MRFFVDGSITTPTTEYLTNPKYQQVEYLESTGTQYIDTGIQGSSALKIGVVCLATKNDTAIIGCGSSAGSSDRLQIFADISYYSCRIAETRVMSDVSWNTKATILLDVPSKKYTINGTDFSIAYTGSVSDRTLWLFGRNIPSDGDYMYRGFIYSCQIWDSGTLVRNYIPAIRKEDGKPGMYDKVSGQFFTNAGTGEFLYGNPVYNGVPKGYKECEYLESAGTQYIDTGITGNNDTKIDILFSKKNTTAFFINGIIGARGSNVSTNNIVVGINNAQIAIDFVNDSSGSYTTYRCIVDNTLEDVKYRAITSKTERSLYQGDALIGQSITLSNQTINTTNLWMFGVQNYGFAKSKIYYCKIYDNGILVRDYVPVLREANNESGMYDRVSNTFFANKGTGAFTYKLKERQTEKVTRIVYSGSKMRLIRNTTA